MRKTITGKSLGAEKELFHPVGSPRVQCFSFVFNLVYQDKPQRPAWSSVTMSSDSFVLQSTCKDGISRLRFSPKGNSESGKQLLLVSSWDCSVSLHDVELNSIVSQYRHPAAVLDCCFGESANKLYSGSLDRSVRCYDVETKIDSKVGSHDNGVRCLEYNTSAGVLVSGGWDNCIKLWDVKRVGENSVQSVPQPGKVFAMDTYGHQIIVAHAGRTLHVYDMRNVSHS